MLQGEVGGYRIRPPAGDRERLLSPPMTQQFSVSAGDHRVGVAQQGFHAMARRRGLPFVPIEMADIEEDLCDLLLGRAVAIPVKGLQHPAQPRALLPRQARVWRDGATVQSR